jgi:hypothetical protein
MFFKGEGRSNLVYTLIALVVVIIIFLTVLLSNQLTKAYINDVALTNWTEDLQLRDGSNSLFGIEKWASFTYTNNDDSYPAYITVTSIKTLFMMSEADLLDKTIEAINNAKKDGIILDGDSLIEGKRKINEDHESMFVSYTGNDTSKDPNEQIKIIGETWNCAVSGTSVICIGFSQISDNLHNEPEINLLFWEQIIGDKIGSLGIINENGLIYNVRCH